MKAIFRWPPVFATVAERMLRRGPGGLLACLRKA